MERNPIAGPDSKIWKRQAGTARSGSPGPCQCDCLCGAPGLCLAASAGGLPSLANGLWLIPSLRYRSPKPVPDLHQKRALAPSLRTGRNRIRTRVTAVCRASWAFISLNRRLLYHPKYMKRWPVYDCGVKMGPLLWVSFNFPTLERCCTIRKWTPNPIPRKGLLRLHHFQTMSARRNLSLIFAAAPQLIPFWTRSLGLTRVTSSDRLTLRTKDLIVTN